MQLVNLPVDDILLPRRVRILDLESAQHFMHPEADEVRFGRIIGEDAQDTVDFCDVDLRRRDGPQPELLARAVAGDVVPVEIVLQKPVDVVARRDGAA